MKLPFLGRTMTCWEKSQRLAQCYASQGHAQLQAAQSLQPTRGKLSKRLSLVVYTSMCTDSIT
jgi:hypothetical protein